MFGETCRGIGVGIVVAFAVCAGPGGAAYGADDVSREALIAEVAGAVEVDSRGVARDDLLLALRGLRDPGLRPVFEAMADSRGSPALRVQGLLGLAEVSDPPRLDMERVKGIADASEQLLVLGQAMRLGAARVEDLEAVLTWSPLAPEVEALALGRLMKEGASVEADRLRRLAGSGALPTRLMAALLLMEMGQGLESQEPFSEVFALPQDQKRSVLGLVLQHIRREEMKEVGPFVARAVEASRDDELLRAEAVHTLLSISPDDAAALWLEMYGETESLATKFLLGLAALEAVKDAPPTLFGRMAADEASEDLRLMGEAGKAIATGADATEALRRMVMRGYEPGAAWVMEVSKTLPSAQASAAQLALVEAAVKFGRERRALQAAAVSAVALLAEGDPAALGAALDEACARKDDEAARLLLAGALRAERADAGAFGAGRTWPSSQSAALAALARARFSPSVDGETMEALMGLAEGRLALGGLFRVQAAWLALKHGGAAGAAAEQVAQMVRTG